MLKRLIPSKRKPETGPTPIELSISSLIASPEAPIRIRSINALHDNIKRRIYRMLIPQTLLARFDIHPIRWQGPDKSLCVSVEAEEGSGKVGLRAWSPFDPEDPFFVLELSDNRYNSIDLDWLILNDPDAPRYDIDVTENGEPTIHGTVRRNLSGEEQAMQAGLSPGQIRAGLRGSTSIFQQIDMFFIAMGQTSLSLEPLTYTSAWVFEKRGFAYIRGHKLMKTIHEEFQPGGKLHTALDGSTPFRQPHQWQTVRGRAWAIHDGILAAVDQRWDGLRMVKQLGQHAQVNTFPDATY